MLTKDEIERIAHHGGIMDIQPLIAHIREQDAALAEARPLIELLARGYADDREGPPARAWLAANPAPKEKP